MDKQKKLEEGKAVPFRLKSHLTQQYLYERGNAKSKDKKSATNNGGYQAYPGNLWAELPEYYVRKASQEGAQPPQGYRSDPTGGHKQRHQFDTE